ncbi:MAG TPA: tRNA (adenosine(37)-N6)-threonylcarbamoyltransferase complex ATPase subunit type 1 TsaE, partial [Patescibacteria group bacterium]|nr:tRNA (adenosine(37)-N6)-threonylcarbamoyltransferase complex ATPase subunit type 1 TsaE [Patescibacteria group bacterium]
MNKNNKFFTKNFEETRRLGENLAGKIDKGTVIALYGDLGSGKTTFVQGFARGLGINRRLTSPTYIILRTYKIKLKTENLSPKGTSFPEAAKFKNSVQKVKNF